MRQAHKDANFKKHDNHLVFLKFYKELPYSKIVEIFIQEGYISLDPRVFPGEIEKLREGEAPNEEELWRWLDQASSDFVGKLADALGPRVGTLVNMFLVARLSVQQVLSQITAAAPSPLAPSGPVDLADHGRQLYNESLSYGLGLLRFTKKHEVRLRQRFHRKTEELTARLVDRYLERVRLTREDEVLYKLRVLDKMSFETIAHNVMHRNMHPPLRPPDGIETCQDYAERLKEQFEHTERLVLSYVNSPEFLDEPST